MLTIVLVVISILTFADMLWSKYFSNVAFDLEWKIDSSNGQKNSIPNIDLSNSPLLNSAFTPTLIPILFIYFNLVANLPSRPFGHDNLYFMLIFLDHPTSTLLVGFFLFISLLNFENRSQKFSEYTSQKISYGLFYFNNCLCWRYGLNLYSKFNYYLDCLFTKIFYERTKYENCYCP